MPSASNQKPYDLEERTYLFALHIRRFVKRLPRSVGNFEDSKQLIRSSGSVGANYIEANESLSRKDFVLRVKIARKEAKESRFWLRLVDCGNTTDLERERAELLQEAEELRRILSTILRRAEQEAG